MLNATHDCLSMRNHHVERNAEGRIHPVKHHAERVTHQQQIAMWIEQARDWRRVGCEADNRALALHRLYGFGRKTFLFNGRAHFRRPFPAPNAQSPGYQEGVWSPAVQTAPQVLAFPAPRSDAQVFQDRVMPPLQEQPAVPLQ